MTTACPKCTLHALEKVFAAEIDGRMHQSKAQIYHTMAAEGLVEQYTVVMGASTRFPVHVTGWILTHRGMILYC